MFRFFRKKIKTNEQKILIRKIFFNMCKQIVSAGGGASVPSIVLSMGGGTTSKVFLESGVNTFFWADEGVHVPRTITSSEGVRANHHLCHPHGIPEIHGRMGEWKNSQIPYFSERKFKQIRRKFIPENDFLTQTILKKFFWPRFSAHFCVFSFH